MAARAALARAASSRLRGQGVRLVAGPRRGAGPGFAQLLPRAPHIVSRLAKLGVHRPSPIQQAAIPALLDGGAARAAPDVAIRAPTGTGKSLAYLLPLLARVDAAAEGAQALIVAPTRELAVQVVEVLRVLTAGGKANAKGHRVRATLVAGARAAERVGTAQVLVATPVVAQQLAKRGVLALDGVRTVVLDEVDFFEAQAINANAVRSLLELMPADPQRVFVSATLSDAVLAGRLSFMRGEPPVLLTAAEEQLPDMPDTLSHHVVDCSRRSRDDALLVALRRMPPAAAALVFTRGARENSRLAALLEAAGVPAGVVDGQIRPGAAKHSEVLRRLRPQREHGRLRAVLCSDRVARGLDIAGATHVINYGMPRSRVEYIHRAGRVGRLGGTLGTVVTLADAFEGARLAHEWGVPVVAPTAASDRADDENEQIWRDVSSSGEDGGWEDVEEGEAEAEAEWWSGGPLS